MKKEDEFEHYWREHKEQILNLDPEYYQTKESYKISSGADLLLFGIPAVAGILSINLWPFQRESLRWLASAGITIICFIVCVWIKSLTISGRSLYEIEKEIKEKERTRYYQQQEY
ncbi:MAG: hypothetical protein IJ196_03915 [Prevotella sp.]|nr:hypothetical protein [Prevotella sp.]